MFIMVHYFYNLLSSILFLLLLLLLQRQGAGATLITLLYLIAKAIYNCQTCVVAMIRSANNVMMSTKIISQMTTRR